MRCLYCGKQLALLRRLTGGGEFCSDAHKSSYHEEYNRLALTRLIAAQTLAEQRSVPSVPSTMRLAAAQRKAPAEGRAIAAPSSHWETAPARSRMLDAPTQEAPPPPEGTFLIEKPAPRADTGPEVASPDLRAIPPPVTISRHLWNPEVASGTTQVPPEAGSVGLDLAPSPSESPLPETLPVAEPVFSAAASSIKFDIEPRAISGLRAKPPLPLSPTQFAPAVDPKPVFEENFERLRFAVMFFGEPVLELMPESAHTDPGEDDRWRQDLSLPESPQPEPEPVPVTVPAPAPVVEPAQAAAPVPENVESKPPATVAPKLAAALKEEPAKQEKGKTGPKLPTIPSSSRKPAPPMPSILQEPEPAESRSLWSSIRKYINK